MTATSKQVRPGQLLAYGSLRMPLALLELPLYVLLPNLYSDSLGVELAMVGAVLFGCRLIDAFADPWIGSTIDRTQGSIDYRRWILLALPVLVVGFWALIRPLPETQIGLLVWLALLSILTYLSYSVVSIAYQAWGARIGNTDSERARVTGYREGAGLVGVLIAAALLTPDKTLWLALLLVALSLISATLLNFAPSARFAPAVQKTTPADSHLVTNLKQVWPNRNFRWLLIVFVINGIATAIPATLVLFFIQDILVQPNMAPMFLAAYFLAGAIGMPLWIRLSAAVGLRNTWLIGIGCSVIAFVWALGLGRGDTSSFMAVCLLTGLALGADLAMPPALLAAVIDSHKKPDGLQGTYFGIWNFVTKANLAVAAGIALPMLSLAGYQPGTNDSLALAIMYAAVPCALKLVAGMALVIAPLPGIQTQPNAVSQ